MFSGLDFAQQNPARRWVAFLSFTVQAAIVMTALVLPLLYPNGLPEALVPHRIFVPLPEGNPQAQPSRARANAASLVHPVPILVNQTRFSFHPSQSGPAADSQPQAPPIGIGDIGIGVVNSIVSENFRPLSPPHPATLAPVRISRIMEGNLIHRIEPQYPPIAKTAGVSGAVIIKALIGRSGSIEQATVVSGSPLLSPAALQAVRQWRYRPYILNNEPVEVETQITVNFVLNR